MSQLVRHRGISAQSAPQDHFVTGPFATESLAMGSFAMGPFAMAPAGSMMHLDHFGAWRALEPTHPKTRLYVDADLTPDVPLALNTDQAHYLGHVLRLRIGDTVALFNGRDGEWRGRIDSLAKGRGHVMPEERLRAQENGPDLWLVFAPIKRARIDFLAEKATELGVSRLVPVFTRLTAVRRVNTRRLRANAIEAAEQCGRLNVPEVAEPETLEAVIAGWPVARRLLVMDETGASPPIAAVLSAEVSSQKAEVSSQNESAGMPPYAILTGPEGGFSRPELDALRDLPFVNAAGMGKRILRADTAALSALTCWQALCGDWR